MMYNVARALALIGLVGVSANNQTSNTTSSGSTAPPQGGDCAAWTALEGVTSMPARRQLSNHTSSGGCATNDVPKCLYAMVDIGGLKSSGYDNSTEAGCPSSYKTTDGAALKEIISKGLCATSNVCVTKMKAALKMKLKCKGTGNNFVAAGGDGRRRLTTKDITLQVQVSAHLPALVASDFTKETIGGLLKTAEGATVTIVQAAVKTAVNGITATSPTVLSNAATAVPTLANLKIALTDATSCSSLKSIKDWYSTQCTGANLQKGMCIHFKAADSNTPSNAISFVVSSLVMAAAVLI